MGTKTRQKMLYPTKYVIAIVSILVVVRNAKIETPPPDDFQVTISAYWSS